MKVYRVNVSAIMVFTRRKLVYAIILTQEGLDDWPALLRAERGPYRTRS
jgi:hypothetical protein